ncbi:hypothetical protein L4D06_10770 [Enterovibrio makurazakiensis]|uniref:hypothetical protein n=1 Tax=Enterovibrio makurazakiensis TaxID=2910232 RepID=UPI003D1B8191
MRVYTYIVLPIFLVLGSFSIANAAVHTIFTTVEAVSVTSDNSFGGCMAKLSESPSENLPSCGEDWVTFSCTGEFTDMARGYKMLDQAQLAFISQKSVILRVRDDLSHDGYCFSERINVSN